MTRLLAAQLRGRPSATVVPRSETMESPSTTSTETYIFEAFERLHTSAEFAGSGLGLATVERIVRRHGGRVWADGTLGEGAVFRFTLAKVHEATPADAPAS